MVFSRNCAISTLRDGFVHWNLFWGLYLWHLQSVAKALKYELSCSSRPVVDSGLSCVLPQGLHWFLSFLTHARHMEQSWHCLYNKVQHFVTLLTPMWHVWPSKEHLDVWFTVNNSNNLWRRLRGWSKALTCFNVCCVFVIVSHAAVCLVQPIFTFYNIMGVWLKYIQLGWSCYFVVSITTQLTKFVGLVVYLFIQWCVTWFSSLATAVLLLFHGTLSLWQLGDLDCYVQVLEPASLFSVSILNCLYASKMQFTSVSCLNCGILRSHAHSTFVPIGSTSFPPFFFFFLVKCIPAWHLACLELYNNRT